MVTRPLGNFVRVTQAIAEGDLNRRVALTRGDEIGELATSFDQMVQRIAVSETENARLYEEAQAQRTRLAQIFDSANEAIISADSSGNIIAWNKGAHTIFGYGEEEVLGKPLTLLMPERFHDSHRLGLERFFSTGESRVIGKTVEFAGRKKDESEFPLELSLASWKMGEETSFTGIIRDITERKRVEKEREKLLHELQDALANVKTLGGLIPICASCKKIRNDQGYWTQVEQYITEHSEAMFSHGICPECVVKFYPEYVDRMNNNSSKDKYRVT